MSTLTRRTIARDSITFPIGPDDATVTVYEHDAATGKAILDTIRDSIRDAAKAQQAAKAAAARDPEPVDADTPPPGDDLDLSDVDLDDDIEADLYRLVLGDALDTIYATPGATYTDVKAIAGVCIRWVQSSKAEAVKAWEAFVAGEAPAPNRAQRRSSTATARKARPASTATKTPKA